MLLNSHFDLYLLINHSSLARPSWCCGASRGLLWGQGWAEPQAGGWQPVAQLQGQPKPLGDHRARCEPIPCQLTPLPGSPSRPAPPAGPSLASGATRLKPEGNYGRGNGSRIFLFILLGFEWLPSGEQTSSSFVSYELMAALPQQEARAAVLPHRRAGRCESKALLLAAAPSTQQLQIPLNPTAI